MGRQRVVRINDAGYFGGGAGLVRSGPARDDAGELYDAAIGPRTTRRPVRWRRTFRPVDEWDDPHLDAVILIVDALAQVEATKKRAASKGWNKEGKRPTKAQNLAGYEHWLSTEEVAEMAGVSLGAVRAMRRRGTGPLSIRLGGWVRFDPVSVRDWIAHRVERPYVQRRYKFHVIASISDTGVRYWSTPVPSGQHWTPSLADAGRYIGLERAWEIAEALQDGTVEVLPYPTESGDTDRV